MRTAITTLAAAASTPAPRRFALEVAPDGVEVLVDGRTAAVENGRVYLEGLLGATREVRLRWRGREETHVVAFAEPGLVPARLAISEPSAPPRQKTPPRPRGAGAQPASSKKESGLSSDVDEFR